MRKFSNGETYRVCVPGRPYCEEWTVISNDKGRLKLRDEEGNIALRSVRDEHGTQYIELHKTERCTIYLTAGTNLINA